MKFLLTLLAATIASAAPITVNFDTSVLPAGSYYIDIQLNSGDDPIGNGNNSATLSGFQFGGGSAVLQQLDGGATGTVAGGFTIVDTDASGFNAILLSLTPGSSLRFNLDVTNNFTSGLNPDQLSFALLDNGFNPIVSSGNGALLTIDLGTGALPQLLPADAAFGGGSVTLTGVPEPQTLTLLVPALAVGIFRLRRRAKLG